MQKKLLLVMMIVIIIIRFPRIKLIGTEANKRFNNKMELEELFIMLEFVSFFNI